MEDAAAAVRVSVQSDDGSFDPATSTADALWTVPVAAAGSSGWRVAALQSDPVLPVGGEQPPGVAACVVTPVFNHPPIDGGVINCDFPLKPLPVA